MKRLKLINSKGEIATQQDMIMQINPFAKKIQPCLVELPKEKGGYLLVAEFHPEGKTAPVISRRYLKIGDAKDDNYSFYDFKIR